MNDVAIHTPRTILRPLALEDAPVLHALWTTPGLRRYLWDDQVVPFERTIAMITHSNALLKERGLGLWGAWAREGGALCGFVGFVYQHEPLVLELGYGIDPAQWGRGLATEIAGAMVKYGFDAGLTEITASLDPANTASTRVLTKLGFVQERQVIMHGVELSFYRCSGTPSRT
jgi:RimJ/RimL family protein N-acetyltransferase